MESLVPPPFQTVSNFDNLRIDRRQLHLSVSDNYTCASIGVQLSGRDARNFIWEGGHLVQTTDAQVRKLMKEIRKTGKVGESALRSGMSRNTATKYLRLGKFPSELKSPRNMANSVRPF